MINFILLVDSLKQNFIIYIQVHPNQKETRGKEKAAVVKAAAVVVAVVKVTMTTMMTMNESQLNQENTCTKVRLLGSKN